MRAGSLRHRLTFQSKSSTGDGMGGFAVKWNDERTVNGAIWPLRGEELFAARQMQGEITHQVRVRYFSGVKPTWRIQLGDSTTYYDIISPPVDPELRHRELILYVKEQV